MTRPHPTLRSRWLGREFEALRKRTPHKITEAARHLGRDPSGVSRFENGIYALPHEEVVTLLDLYEVPEGQHRDALTQLSQEEWRTDWWDAYADDVDGSLLDAIWLESKARAIHAFDLTYINGLLQTPGYIRSLAQGALPSDDTEGINRLVEMRLARQTVMERVTPPRLQVVLDEAALRRAVGGPSIMAAQVRRLAEEARARPTTQVRVLPFSAWEHAGPDCGFRVLELDDPLPDVVLLDRPYGMVVVEPPDSDHFAPVYASLVDAALGPDESIEFLSGTAAELERA